MYCRMSWNRTSPRRREGHLHQQTQPSIKEVQGKRAESLEES